MGFSLGKTLKSAFGSSSGKSFIGSALGAFGGSFFGMPNEGAAIGSSLASMFGPSDERLERRQYNLEKKRALELWNMENAYNSPLQQMQRLQEAGLNPMLVYSSGNVTGNSSSSIDLSTAKRQVPDRFDKSTFDFFLRNQMESAENQNETQELQNERLRLQNQKLAMQIEEMGKPKSANKIRQNKPMTLTEVKTLNKIIHDKTQPSPIKGAGLSAVPNLLENIIYNIVDKHNEKVDNWSKNYRPNMWKSL